MTPKRQHTPVAMLNGVGLVASWIAARRPPDGTLVVGIDGPGAAGKSTLAADLAGRLDAAVVTVDDFYRPAAERSTLRVRPRRPARRHPAMPMRRG